MSAFDKQEGGSHYTKCKIQPFQYSMANNLDPMQHTVVKYVTRFRDKGGVADLKKAIHTLELLIEHENAKTASVKPVPKEPTRDDLLRELRTGESTAYILHSTYQRAQDTAIREGWPKWVYIPIHEVERVRGLREVIFVVPTVLTPTTAAYTLRTVPNSHILLV